jgi:hypothetical protein
MKKVQSFFKENWQVILILSAWFGGIGFIAYKFGV